LLENRTLPDNPALEYEAWCLTPLLGKMQLLFEIRPLFNRQQLCDRRQVSFRPQPLFKRQVSKQFFAAC
jgi:hypothetical protein